MLRTYKEIFGYYLNYGESTVYERTVCSLTSIILNCSKVYKLGIEIVSAHMYVQPFHK